MKILLASLLVLLVSTYALETFTEGQLDTELSENKKIWLVYRSGNGEHEQIITKVESVLRGFFRVVAVNSEDHTLQIYTDDRADPISYSGEYTVNSVVLWALEKLDEVIAQRSEQAKSLKAQQEYLEREKERANKEWSEEQELRKKSNTLILDYASWSDVFLKAREPFLINFYEGNNSACIELNRVWEEVSSEFKGKVKVAKINLTEASNHRLEEQLRISSYPEVRFYANGPKKADTFSLFEGLKKRTHIFEWIQEKLSQKATKADIASLNKQNYETLCKATKNTCIIAFLDGSEDASTEQKIQKLALDHIKKPITFLISRKGEQDAFAQQLGVQSYPDTVMVYYKLKKVWRMQGLDFQAIEDGINEISLGNRNNFVRLAIAENLQ